MDDNTKYSVKEYRNRLYEEIIKRRREKRKQLLLK